MVASGVASIKRFRRISVSLFPDFFLGLLELGYKYDGILEYAAGRLVYEAYKLVADCRGDTLFHIGEVGVAVGGHCHVDVYSLGCITGNGGVTRTIYRAVERKIGRLFGVHYQHIVDIELETVFQILEMSVMQVAVGSSLMSLRVKDAVVAESKPARFDKYAVFQRESGVEHIYL